jgi:predicted XRE-type DNA-binding protein
VALEHELKQLLAGELCAILASWSQGNAAALVGTHQSEISRLRRRDLRRFSLTRLLRLASRACYDVEIRLTETPGRRPEPRGRPGVAVVRYDRYGRLVQNKG